MQRLRIGVVADIHAGAPRSNIRSGEALALLESVIADANADSVDLFVTLGDNVIATSAEDDYRHLTQVADTLRRLDMPCVPLFGNNDMKYLDVAQAAAALQCEAGSEVRQVKGWSLIFWRPECDLSLEEGIDLPESDIAWLRAALATATYPTVIFLHAPIDGQSMIGNYYFEGRPDLSGYSNGATARSVIEASAKVVLVLAGHVHWNSGTTIDGVHYRTLACLTDTFQAGADASRTWAVLDLDASSISLDVRGAEPMRWSAPPRPDHAHWKKPMASEAFDKRMRTLWSGGQVAP